MKQMRNQRPKSWRTFNPGDELRGAQKGQSGDLTRKLSWELDALHAVCWFSFHFMPKLTQKSELSKLRCFRSSKSKYWYNIATSTARSQDLKHIKKWENKSIWFFPKKWNIPTKSNGYTHQNRTKSSQQTTTGSPPYRVCRCARSAGAGGAGRAHGGGGQDAGGQGT